MANLTVEKNLLTQEDIAYGEGTVAQVRGGGNYLLNEVRTIVPVNSLDELNALDTTKFLKAMLFINGVSTPYSYYSGAWHPDTSLPDAIGELTVETFADLATTPETTLGMVVYLKQHTSGGLGGGHFIGTAGTVTNDGGTVINNSVTSGRHWKRVGRLVAIAENFGALPYPFDSLVPLQLLMSYASSNNTSAMLSSIEYYISAPIVIGLGFRSFCIEGEQTGNAQTGSVGSCIVTNGTYDAIQVNFTVFTQENIRVFGVGFYNITQDTLSGGNAVHLIKGAATNRYITGIQFKNCFFSGFGAAISFQGMNEVDALQNFIGTTTLENVHVVNCGIALYIKNACLNLLSLYDCMFHDCPFGGIRLDRNGLATIGKGSIVIASLFKCHMEGVGGMIRTQVVPTLDGGGNTLRSAVSLYDLSHEFCGQSVSPTTGDPLCLGVDTDVFVYGAAVRGLSYGEDTNLTIRSGCSVTSTTPIICEVMPGGKILSPEKINAPFGFVSIANGANYTIAIPHADGLGYSVASKLLFAGGQAGFVSTMHTGIDAGTRTNTVLGSFVTPGVVVTYPVGTPADVVSINIANTTGFTLEVDYTTENFSNSTILS